MQWVMLQGNTSCCQGALRKASLSRSQFLRLFCQPLASVEATCAERGRALERAGWGGNMYLRAHFPSGRPR
jgi:hypothetical protein